jgi:hypothetical protein
MVVDGDLLVVRGKKDGKVVSEEWIANVSLTIEVKSWA